MFPTSNPRSLNQSPNAVDFLERISVPSGRKAATGDPEAVPTLARPAVTNANAALARLADMIPDIVKDQTRPSDAEKHDAARTVGLQTIATLGRSKAALEAQAAELMASADEAVGEAFAPNPNRVGIEGEIRAHVRELATKETGIADIRKLMNNSAEVASVVCHSPAFLTGLAPPVQDNLRFDAIKRHVPAAWKMLEQSVELTQLASKYDAVSKSVRGTWFDAIADGVSTRVNVSAVS